VLCDLEGKTRGEVARQLGWPEGTVASRLARGRGMLASRLARRGFPAVFVAALADGAASATVPAELSISTATAASSWATAGAVVEPVLTAKVVALTEGVLQSMLLSKIKSAIAALLLIAIAGLGAGGMISRTLATEPANPDDLQDRVQELKQQLLQMHNKIAKLEEEAQPRRDQRDGSLASLFKHRVPFETGLTESNEGGRIEISEVRGTRPRIEVGGQYLVRGKYVLPRGERGKLYLYLTAEGWSQPSATLDLQNAVADKPEGEFTLVHAMAGPGYFHIYLAHPDRYSRTFANLYFGTGDNVLRKKP